MSARAELRVLHYILCVLGVPSNEIFADYMLSAKARYLLELVLSMARAMEAKYGHRVRDELTVKLLGVEGALSDRYVKQGRIEMRIDRRLSG